MSRFERAWRSDRRRLGRFVFGDRVGATLWLGLVVALAFTWRVGFFITDNYTIANALVNVADGHLAITEIQYSLTLGSQPGLHTSGGQLYGRNYGQVFLALPLVWLLEAASLLTPLHLVLAGGWSLAILAFSRQLATVVDRPAIRGVGSVVAVGTFGVNVLGGRPLDPDLLELAALQLSTLFAAAFAGVLFYRLVGVFHHRRVAIGAGVVSVIAFPIGFWASIPKRHVLVATLLLASTYCFARSRQATGRREYVALAGAYVFASLVAWVHAFEGFFALAALGSVDLLTGGIRDRKRLAVIAFGLAVGLAPMFLTNALISGDPLEPPRLLPNQGSAGLELAPTGEVRATDGGSSGGSGGSAGRGGDPLGFGSSSADGGDGGNPLDAFAPVLGPLQGSIDKFGFIAGFVMTVITNGLGALGDPERLWHIFGRSGRIPHLRLAINQFEMIELTVLESAPILGGLLALPAVLAREGRGGETGESRRLAPWRFSARGQTDLFVIVAGSLLTVVYLSRLPLHTQITVRYLLYAMPFWLYGVVRLPPVREAVIGAPKRVVVTYGLAAIGGTVVFAAVLAGLNVAIGEAMQFHALVNLWTAGLVALLVGGRALVPERVRVEWVGTGLGVAAGSTTAFLLLAGLAYFQYGPFALELSRGLSAATGLL